MIFDQLYSTNRVTISTGTVQVQSYILDHSIYNIVVFPGNVRKFREKQFLQFQWGIANVQRCTLDIAD